MCGGNPQPPGRKGDTRGLSPRVRGKPISLYFASSFSRSIPACAGETLRLDPPDGQRTVYPRVCGGNATSALPPARWHGLSPRVRGKRCAGTSARPLARSIPACAGETETTTANTTDSKVYPRVCGGNAHSRPPAAASAGLSPRVRGKRAFPPARCCQRRSIPACAGETAQKANFPIFGKVYPRVCGGNGQNPPQSRRVKGLSPRVRGKLKRKTSARGGGWSIPACAGETARAASRL